METSVIGVAATITLLDPEIDWERGFLGSNQGMNFWRTVRFWVAGPLIRK